MWEVHLLSKEELKQIVTILTSSNTEQTGNTSREIFTKIAYTEDTRNFYIMNEYLKAIIYFLPTFMNGKGVKINWIRK